MFNLGEALPAIQRNLAPVGAQAIANIILPQIAQINAQINAQISNIILPQIAQINSQINNVILPQIAQINAQINALTNDIILPQIGQINVQFTHINNRFDFLEQVIGDNTIRIENSHATHDNDPIIAIRHKNAPVLGVLPLPLPPLPANFPATRGELFRLNTARLNIFLNYYGENLNGAIEVKRRRLARFLGLQH